MKKETGMYGRRNQWWGWGSPEVGYPLKNREGLVLYLESRLGELQPPVREVSVGAVKVPPPGLTGDEVGQLERMVGRKSVRLEDNVRIIYSFGKSYQDLVRVRNGLVDLVTDAVVFPENEDQIEAILRWAVDRDVAIIPFGGGTSVVGGVERDESSAKTVTVALERLSRVLSIDRTSMTARCQGGITGPELEKDLARAGFSLGHFPQSFEYSTLGGWIATRGAGQASTKYGKIEHMVQSVRIVTPEGVVESRSFPAQAAGSDLAQSIVGSEGSLGIITEAVMKIHRTPELCDTRGYLFKDFTAGMETVRQILQAGIVPAIVRLSDREETALSVKLGEFEKGGVDFKQRVGEWYLGRRGFSLTGSCLLILGFEGTRDGVKYERRMGERIIRRGATISLGKSPGESWRKRRFQHPYLRDELIASGLLVDTLETSAGWSALSSLYEGVVSTLENISSSMGTGGLVLTHLSHAYHGGASLYFTFMFPAKAEEEIDQWERIKSEAVEAILANGGSLSHHHGIGKDHVRWMERFLGKDSLEMLRGIKKQLDPFGIMNPGTLTGTVRWGRERGNGRGAFSIRTRTENVNRLMGEQFDLLVIGGGITGAGIAWDAALRGLKVGLVEKGDFGSGTSSRSSKMIHGGLRYLKQLNVKLVKESLHERGILLKLAPHLVNPQGHVIPIYGRTALKMMELRIGLTGYDILAGKLNIARHEKLSPEEVVQRVPNLKKEGLQGGFRYHDCLVDDARLTLTVILSAAQAGAVAANYTKAQNMVFHEGAVAGVECEDLLTGKSGTIEASVVVSAAGPWTDEVRHFSGGEGNRLRPTKGIHLVFKRDRLPSDDVVVLFAADQRPLYLVPAGGCCYVGTTDTDYNEDLDEIRATAEDTAYILDTIRAYFPERDVGPDDVLGYWAGVRPLVAMEGSPSRVSRDTMIHHETDGLVLVAGGKLTAFRAMAEEVVDDVLEIYGSRFKGDLQGCKTDSTRLVGGELEAFDSYRKAVQEILPDSWPIAPKIRDHLVSAYGTRFLSILGYGLENPFSLKPLYSGSEVILGEIRHAVEEEMAVTLDDFMGRRTGLKYFTDDHALPVVSRIARMMGARLGWSFSETRRQIEKYFESVETATTIREGTPTSHDLLETGAV